MIPILYKESEVDFTNNGLGALNELYNVDVEEQRNGLFTLKANYPVSGVRYKDIEVGKIIFAKPNQNDKSQAFRIVHTQLDLLGHALNIEADHITYDLTHNLIKSVRLFGNGQAVMEQLQKATMTPHLFTFFSDLTHNGESTLEYVNPMEAIAGTQGSILQIWGGEMKRENRKVSMLTRRGRNNFTSFRLGKNINGLKYTVDTNNLVTRVIPTIKQTKNDKEYFIVGNTVDSKNITKYSTVYYKHVDMSEFIAITDKDTDATIKTKINAQAKTWFTQSANSKIDLPDVTIEIDVTSLQDSADFQEKFSRLEAIELTDTVTVYVPEFGVNVEAVVNEIHYDPMAERVTSLVIGTARTSFTDANRNKLTELQNKVNQIRHDANLAASSADGKNTNYYGTDTPKHPVEGDLWFKKKGDDDYILVFKEGVWSELVNTRSPEAIDRSIEDVIQEAKEYTDGKKILLDGDVTATGDFYAQGGKFKNLNASNMTTGTLNASTVNLINLNASALTTGIIHGPNLDINLNSGLVTFQKGRLWSTNGAIDMNIDQGYLSVANYKNNVLIRNGEIAFTQPNLFSPDKDPYLRITNDVISSSFASATVKAKYGIEFNIKGNEASIVDMGVQSLAGIKFGKGNSGKLERTLIGGGNQGVEISGGTITTGMLGASPSIVVGQNKSQNGAGNRVFINAEYLHAFAVHNKTTSGSANVIVASDGALVRATSARKYKTDIKNDVPLTDSEKLLNIPLSTWDDIAELKERGKSRRYFGMIAEEVAEAGLDYLVTREPDGTIEGLEYDRIALLLIPMVKQLKDEIKELKDERKTA